MAIYLMTMPVREVVLIGVNRLRTTSLIPVVITSPENLDLRFCF